MFSFPAAPAEPAASQAVPAARKGNHAQVPTGGSFADRMAKTEDEVISDAPVAATSVSFVAGQVPSPAANEPHASIDPPEPEAGSAIAEGLVLGHETVEPLDHRARSQVPGADRLTPPAEASLADAAAIHASVVASDDPGQAGSEKAVSFAGAASPGARQAPDSTPSAELRPDSASVDAAAPTGGSEADPNVLTESGKTLSSAAANMQPAEAGQMQASPSTDSTQLAAAAPSATPGLQPASAPAPVAAASPPLPVATLEELPNLVANMPVRVKDSDERVIVQLDPPELGRVAIDFKFSGNGLQHVTITAELPESLNALRQIHHQLLTSLERHGLLSDQVSFNHDAGGFADRSHDQNASFKSNPGFSRRADDSLDANSTGGTNLALRRPFPVHGDRLDIRL